MKASTQKKFKGIIIKISIAQAFCLGIWIEFSYVYETINSAIQAIKGLFS